jgi:CCR4-NOT transcription complex subunit 1
MLVLYQGEPDGAVKPTKDAYLDQLLCMLVILQVNHIKERGEHANYKVFFRLYSDLLYEFHKYSQKLGEAYDDIMLVFARFLTNLQPRWFPGFAFSWLSLVSHRFFMTPILRAGAQQSVSCISIGGDVKDANMM